MKYKELRNQTYRRYKRIKAIYCPYLKRKVTFNSNGFRHIIYKAGGKKRDIKTQILRFKLIEKAVKILKITTTLQEYQSEAKAKIGVVTYFGFISILEGWKIKIIVKKIGKGKPFFWSIIPNWRTRNKEKLLFKGNLEDD